MMQGHLFARPAPPPMATPRAPADLPPEVPAISLWQPYAGLVAAKLPGAAPGAAGLKSLETRRRRTHHRGPLVICATLKSDDESLDRLWPHIPEWARPACLAAGVALAVVDVVGCRPLVPDDEPAAWFYVPERWAWELAWCRPFRRPFAVKGSQGFFRVGRDAVVGALEP